MSEKALMASSPLAALAQCLSVSSRSLTPGSAVVLAFTTWIGNFWWLCGFCDH